MGNVQLIQVSSIIKESWAEVCEQKICEIEYRDDLGKTDYEHHEYSFYKNTWNLFCSTCSDYEVERRKKYTPLFIDLIDDHNQNSSTRPNDMITGYDLADIEFEVLYNSYGLHSLRNNLLTYKPDGVSDADINTYMNYYFENL